MDPDDVRAADLDGDGDGELIRMAKFIVEDFEKEGLGALSPQLTREVIRKCLEAGAKVVQKETSNYIYSAHRASGDLSRSVKPSKVHEDVDASWIEVYPQDYDSRGVSNEMKAHIIVNGYYNRASGRSKRKKDNFLPKVRKRVEPRILSVMEYQFDLCMKKINGG